MFILVRLRDIIHLAGRCRQQNNIAGQFQLTEGKHFAEQKWNNTSFKGGWFFCVSLEKLLKV